MRKYNFTKNGKLNKRQVLYHVEKSNKKKIDSFSFTSIKNGYTECVDFFNKNMFVIKCGQVILLHRKKI